LKSFGPVPVARKPSTPLIINIHHKCHMRFMVHLIVLT
jgi:hypothetical protein